jgi:hypothetical protein
MHIFIFSIFMTIRCPIYKYNTSSTAQGGGGSFGKPTPKRLCSTGLGPNLAYFVLRFGEGAMREPDAPVVFVNGVPASLEDQCATRITEEAIRFARWVLEEESQPRRRDRDQNLRDMSSQPPGERTDAREEPEPSLDKTQSF